MIIKLISILLVIFLSIPIEAQSKPYEVDNFFDTSDSLSLGLNYPNGIENITIFMPVINKHQYNHGVVLYPFQDKLFAMWQSSKKNEDENGTQILYSYSKDGENWSAPTQLTKPWNGGIKTSGGWWSFNDDLIAFINVWPYNGKKKQGFTHYKVSKNGLKWSPEKPVLNAENFPIKGIIEQDLDTLVNGRILTAFHMQPGLKITPSFTDNPSAIRGWTMGKIKMPQSNDNMSRGIEPSWFTQSDGSIVMVFRDQESSFKQLAAISNDLGVSWTDPVIVNMPDSRAKQSAGNLVDGTAFIINNPSGNKNRFPLAITLSKDGKHFTKSYLLRNGGSDLPEIQFEGKYKRKGFSYPKSVIWNDYLYVGYATNKETIELTRIPLKSISLNSTQ
ncbi:exo-alpha-sialidase [Aegicerativicinus sediminis]|uniref:exo-alpha-sialidase n=1 Tax=Aegicerativicinus sediminis TaxID=2893202 RepID=UPI001E5D36B5|nr:exo-alpha-sialidase [Aegicerativicinus sediminis]